MKWVSEISFSLLTRGQARARIFSSLSNDTQYNNSKDCLHGMPDSVQYSSQKIEKIRKHQQILIQRQERDF